MDPQDYATIPDTKAGFNLAQIRTSINFGFNQSPEMLKVNKQVCSP